MQRSLRPLLSVLLLLLLALLFLGSCLSTTYHLPDHEVAAHGGAPGAAPSKVTLPMGDRVLAMTWGGIPLIGGGGWRPGLISTSPDVVLVEFEGDHRRGRAWLLPQRPGQARLYYGNQLAGFVPGSVHPETGLAIEQENREWLEEMGLGFEVVVPNE